MLVSAHTKIEVSPLPLRSEPRHSRFENAPPDSAYLPTVLIVDDIDLNRRLLRGILKATPYRILEAKRPSAAFSVLDTEKVDLIVVDLVLPEMSGMQFCQMVKSDRRTQLIPILMLTSIQGIENEVAGLESGADDFLLKPLRPALVRTRVSTMLRNKAQGKIWQFGVSANPSFFPFPHFRLKARVLFAEADGDRAGDYFDDKKLQKDLKSAAESFRDASVALRGPRGTFASWAMSLRDHTANFWPFSKSKNTTAPYGYSVPTMPRVGCPSPSR